MSLPSLVSRCTSFSISLHFLPTQRLEPMMSLHPVNRMRTDGDEKDGDDRDVVDAGRHRVLHQIQKSCRSGSLSLLLMLMMVSFSLLLNAYH